MPSKEKIDRAIKIAKNLGREEPDDNISPEITGNFQISAHEKERVCQVLDSERRDGHVPETLFYMYEEQNLFDNSGWKIVKTNGY